MKFQANCSLVVALMSALVLLVAGTPTGAAAPSAALQHARTQGPCDIYQAAGTPCVAAHSTTRALYAAYNGPLYQVLRQSDGKTLNIGVVASSASDAGGYANAAAQDVFCANTYCWIAKVFDQSPRHNDLVQAPRGAFSGPAMGGFNNLPLADMAPVTVMGHKVYGVYIEPGMGLRQNDAKGTAVDDQAQGQYWVVNGSHYNAGCCFDYGNAEIDSRDEDDGTMETTYFGDSTGWYHGAAPGPWIMTDQENNLVGCANPDGSKFCTTLPNIDWRFVTAMAKGEPHHWTTLGGDAQRGDLAVMFDGPRINGTYDPMRKQGAILLGNGGDNSNGSQGTFYEGAMTAAGTFPADAVDRQVQANIVAAHYNVQRLRLAPASAAAPPGLQIFTPGSSQDVAVSFTNTTGARVTGLRLGVTTPRQWTAVQMSNASAGPVASGASVSATFKIASGLAAFNGDLVATASWINADGTKQSEKAAEKVRNVSPVKINEFRANAPDNATNAFIELFNAGVGTVDVSNWSLTQHQTQQAIFSAVKIPAGTKIAPHGFYLLGLSSSGLAAPALAGDSTLYVRNTTGLSVGDTITIGTGADAETRKIASVGTAAGPATTLWQPLPDGPVIAIPAGATHVPVTGTSGFAVGEKIAIGHGARYPAVARGVEQYEVRTVTAIGKPGTQAYLGANVAPGDTNIKVTNVANLMAGDRIRLDIDSMGHGIETVTIKSLGTAAVRTNLTADVPAGATSIRVRSIAGLMAGHKLNIGTPANRQVVTITSVSPAPPGGPGQGGGGLGGQTPGSVEFVPALVASHIVAEHVVDPGTGLELAAPLRFAHEANLPFSARGTGISFTPAAKFAHSSNEPVQPLGTGITLDRPLARAHGIDAVVRDAAATGAGYQGGPAPNQWFGGPAPPASAGSMVLRDSGGLVVDSLNYGLIVDPWAAEGYQGVSGAGEAGCRVTSPGPAAAGARAVAAPATNRSAGRFPDGQDSASNCNDFRVQPATTIAVASAAGATDIKVPSVANLVAGQIVMLDPGTNQESATIASVGTGGGTTTGIATEAGTTVLPVASAAGFNVGQTVTIDAGAKQETALIVAAAGGGGGARLTIAAPLGLAHAAGVAVSGTGVTLATALNRAHAAGAQILGDAPTPGAPNRY